MTMYDGPWEDVEYEEDEDEVVLRGAPKSYDLAVYLKFDASCPECGFTSRDIFLLNNHSCDIQNQGGRCEDYPCCGHEFGDCNGLRYGSDEAIKAQVYAAAHDPYLADALERQAEYDEYWR